MTYPQMECAARYIGIACTCYSCRPSLDTSVAMEFTKQKINDLQNRVFDLERELSSIKANQEKIIAILQILKDK